MTGLFARISRVLKAAITGRPGRHDRRTELLSRRYEQQLQQLQTVKRDIADVLGVQKQLRLGHSTSAQDARSLEHQISELEDAEQRLCDAEHKLRARKDAFRADQDAVDAKRWRPEAEAHLSGAVADVGDALADVAVVVQRAVEKTEDMKLRASVLERRHDAGTLDGAAASGRDRTSPPVPRPPTDATRGTDVTGSIAGQEAPREQPT
jgi:phage shock protein A